jgi:hypothetical protein
MQTSLSRGRSFKRRKATGSFSRRRPRAITPQSYASYSLRVLSRPMSSDLVPVTYKLSRRESGALTSSGAIAANNWSVNNPNPFTDWASIENLCDLYRVVKYVWKFYPSTNDSLLQPVATSIYAPFFVCYDPDSKINATSVDQIVQFNNYKAFVPDKPYKYTVYPKVSYDSTNLNSVRVVFDPKWGCLLDQTQAASYVTGVIQSYADNLLGSTNYGTLVHDMYVQTFTRR